MTPSPVMGKPNPHPQSVQFHFHDNYPSPDNPPQDLDNSVRELDLAMCFPIFEW